MCGFILWIREAWEAFDTAHGIKVKGVELSARRLRRYDVLRPHRIDPQVAFDMFLNGYTTKVTTW